MRKLLMQEVGLETTPDRPPIVKEKDKRNLDPFNVTLLKLTPAHLKDLTPITVPDIIQSSTKNLHPEGLYSTEIFGMVGTPERKRTYSYIDLKVDIMQPIFFKYLIRAKRFFNEILSGKAYATWDPEENTFIPAEIDEAGAETGYSFFMEHLSALRLPTTGSRKRDVLINLKEKMSDKLVISKLLVMPAGLREVTLAEDSGYPEDEDEVNEFYRVIFNMSNGISENVYRSNPASLDNVRYQIQTRVLQLYDYLFSISIGGKNKFALGKWSKRGISHGTRNVLTAISTDSSTLGGKRMIKPSETVVGLYQYLKMTGPLSIHNIKSNEITSRVFPGMDLPANLIDKKTLRQRSVTITSETYDKYTSKDGIEKLVDRFSMVDLRHLPMEVNNHWLALIYKDDHSYLILSDIRDLPKDLNPDNVSPMTLVEYLYLSVYKEAENLPVLITRYPVAAEGGIYPSYTYLTTTTKTKELTKRLPNGEMSYDPSDTAKSYPINNITFYDSFSPHTTHLARLGADFDGDAGSVNALLTDESRQEVKDLLNSAKYYVSPDGGMTYSCLNDISDLTLKHLTTDME